MLELKNVSKKYKSQYAVDNVSMNVRQGDLVGLLGPNGAGKSTTISMIATLLYPDQGVILFEGNDIRKNPTVLRKVLGYVPQEISLFESLTGYDNLVFWGKAYHLGKDTLKRAIEWVTAIIGFTDLDLKKKVSTYSGGMKRRLNIGVALLHAPKLVLMDEPTVGLDIEARQSIIRTIREINALGVTIIYTGHYLDEIEEMCNRIIIIKEGKIISDIEKVQVIEQAGALERYYMDAIKQHVIQ